MRSKCVEVLQDGVAVAQGATGEVHIGRAKGTPNRKTAEYKERIRLLLEKIEYEMDVQEDIKHLKPNERVDLYVKLMSYVCPKPETRTELHEELRRLRESIGMIVSNV